MRVGKICKVWRADKDNYPVEEEDWDALDSVRTPDEPLDYVKDSVDGQDDIAEVGQHLELPKPLNPGFPLVKDPRAPIWCISPKGASQKTRYLTLLDYFEQGLEDYKHGSGAFG